MGDQIASEDTRSHKREVLGRGAALRRSGLIFLGGFATTGAIDTPAVAAQFGDHPISGQGYAGPAALVRTKKKGPAFGLPGPKGYKPCRYIATVLKKAGDLDPNRHGVPTVTDLMTLRIPVPSGYSLLAAYRLDHSEAPAVFGYDENLRFHGNTETDEYDVGTPLGKHGEANSKDYYDVFLLVYG